MGIMLTFLPDFASPETWISLLTLTFLEVVLGVDNIIFISIASNKLKKAEQARARKIGLILAMAFRILLLMGISYLIAMQTALWHFESSLFSAGITGQSLILIGGGIFLIYKATSEIHHKLEGGDQHDEVHVKKGKITLQSVIIQIVLIDMVFSFDSILTAVGLTSNLFIMIVAVILSISIMMLFASPIATFVNTHPTIQMLALAFLIMIGFMLIVEGAHLSEVVIAGSQIGSVPKGYLYFAIVFSLGVEFLNMRLRKRTQRPIQLHGIPEQAKKEGVIS